MYCDMIQSTFYNFIYISSCLLERTDVQECSYNVFEIDPTSLIRHPVNAAKFLWSVSDRINGVPLYSKLLLSLVGLSGQNRLVID